MMRKQIKYILLFFTFFSLEAKEPNLVLLNVYMQDNNITSWYMSEKLDGVRAYWDGSKLISRSGRVFSAPRFFTQYFPKHKLDGELWSKRGDFSNISSIVNKKKPHEDWGQLTYNIFEVPNAKGNLLQRLSQVKESQYIKLIKQIEVKDKKHLASYLKLIEKNGGEGIVVRDGSLEYYTGRNNNALKVKSYVDEECEIVAHHEGNGKFKGKLGALSCRMNNAKIIKIGTGFSDAQRDNSPKIGTIITFKYYGLTSKGNPRFPVFLRIKEEK